MACALCGSNDDGEGGLCPRCAKLPSSFTETLGPASKEEAPGGLPDRDREPPPAPKPFTRDRTSPVLDVALPLAVHTGLTFGPGESFAGRYTIVEEVGSGGMGLVYKALDRQLGRAVALKLIKPDHAARPEARERFQRELLLAQQVTHPNVCRVHDLGEVGEIRYISMEFVEGQTLEDLIHSVGHLSAKQTVTLGKQICAGLGAVHDRGIVHRDLKPGNVMIDRAGHALVMDFGMAYRPGGEKLTAAGAVLGTLAYLSPEHARGYPTDARSDLYAIGLILFEMLTGRRPPGDENSLPLAVRDSTEVCPPPSRLVPEVPPALDAVVLRCLEREPGKRYGRAGELEQALAEIGTSLSSLSNTLLPAPTPVSPITVPVPPVPLPRRPWVWLAAGAALVALGIPAWERIFPPKARVTSVALMVFDYQGPEATRVLRELLPAVVGDALRVAPDLQVASFASTRAFGSEEPPRTVAESLGVEHVVKGTVRVAGGRVDTQLLVFPRTGNEPLRVSRTGEVGGTADLADRLAADIAEAVGRRVPRTKARNALALELYFGGRQLLEGWDVERNYEKAEQAFERALALDPSFAEARAGLALALTNHFQETRAGAVIERASQEARRAAQEAPTLPEAQLALGVVHLLRGRSAEAALALQRARELAPADDEVCRRIAWAYDRQNREKEAERYFEEAIRLRNTFWENYNAFGRFLARRGDYGKAREMFERVIQLRPRSDTGFINLAGVYIWEGSLEKAEPLLLDALKLGRSLQAHNDLGFVYYGLGRFEDAAQQFQAALDAGGPQAEPFGGLGDALRQLGRREQAREAYANALRLARARLQIDPEDAGLRAGLAMFLAGSGACRDARQEAARATKGPGGVPVNAFSYAAVAYAICGDHEAAVRESMRAVAGGALVDVRSNPDLERVREDARIRDRLQEKTPEG